MKLAAILAVVVCLAGTARAEPFTVPQRYFRDGAAARGAEAWALERWKEARDEFAAARARTRRAATRARLTLLVGLADRRLRRWAEAASALDAATKSLPLIADYARYAAAESYYHLGDLNAARARAASIPAGAVLHAEAQLLLGDVLRAEERWADVEAHYDAYLRRSPDGIRHAEARWWLAQARERLGRPVASVITLYREIGVRAPLSSWAAKAQARLDELSPRLPTAERARAKTLTARELVTRGMVYYDAMRNESSEADFAAALNAGGLDDDLRCVAAYHRAQSVFKQRERRRAAPLFDEAIAACAKTKQADLQVRAAYQGARCWGSAGDREKAIALFERAETIHPWHTFVDDARLRRSEQWAEIELEEPKRAAEADAKITELLSTLPEKHPRGDMRAEALWRLAWRAWRRGDHKAMIGWLQKQEAAVPHDDNYWAEGQTGYWMGRAYAALGRDAEAHAAYRRAIRQYPLSYYALLALNRLREGAPAQYREALAEIRRPPPGWKKGTPALRFAPRPLWGEPAYRRAVELLRLGLGDEAQRELARLGLKAPPGKREVTDRDQAELLWAAALLYDRARRYDVSHWIPRWSVLDYKRAWPTAANRAKWDLAYPRAWWHLVEPASKAQGVPPELSLAFIREESAFNPILESFANAIGLMQMIMPTARRFGAGLGFEVSRETLRDPAKNVAIGSRFLGFLWSKFRQQAPLLVAGYNAGEGAVWRWLCERGGWKLDEFGEAIPYDETRNYTKRVLSTYFTYSYLRDKTVPVVSNVIPSDVINESACPRGKARRDEADKPDRSPPTTPQKARRPAKAKKRAAPERRGRRRR